MVMDMGWEDYLHLSFNGEHVLFQFIPLNSFSSFLVACILTTAICLFERYLTHLLNTRWHPGTTRSSRLRTAISKATVYWLATLLRLAYMLIAMSYHTGLILYAVTVLSLGQCVSEYMAETSHEPDSYTSLDCESVEERLLGQLQGQSPSSSHSHSHPPPRLRTKSKPEGIFIHPNHSNIARADARAIELGLPGSGSTERVSGYMHPPAEDAGWSPGAGREYARALFNAHARNASVPNVDD